jgi:hypothetical protein
VNENDVSCWMTHKACGYRNRVWSSCLYSTLSAEHCSAADRVIQRKTSAAIPRPEPHCPGLLDGGRVLGLGIIVQIRHSDGDPLPAQPGCHP